MKMKKFLALAMTMCMIFSMTTAAFAAGDGTKGNPEVLTELTGDTVTIPGGTNTDEYTEYYGYYYSYTVPDDVVGTAQLSFCVDESSQEEYFFNVDNLTTFDYVEIAPQDYETNKATIKASAGDVIQIKIMSAPEWNDDWSVATYPEIDMVWSAEMITVGTVDSPEVIETLDNYGFPVNFAATVIPNANGYYLSYVAEATGTLSIFIDESATVDMYDPEYPDIVEDDPMLVNDIAELKGEIVLTNKNSNVVKKMSEGTTQIEINTGRMVYVYDAVQIPVKEGDEITICLSSAATGYENGINVVCGGLIEEPYGAAGNPVSVYENYQEITIPAGEKYYISIDSYEFVEFSLSITGGDAKAYSYEGNEYQGLSGIVVEQNEDNYGYMFQLENTSAKDVTYTIEFIIPLGSYNNPDHLDTNDEKTVKIEEGNTSYYYYEWKAVADGIVYLTVDSTADWRYSVDNITTNAWADYVSSVDEKINHIVMEVSKGDVLSVYVSAVNYDTDSVDEDTDVTTTIKFKESVGTLTNAEDIEEIIGGYDWETDSYTGILGGEYDETGVIELDMENTDGTLATILPGALLEAIRDYNISLVEDYQEDPIAFTIVLKMGDYTWKLTNITGFAPVDLGIDFEASNTDKNVIDKVAEGDDYITFEIGHDGNFGFDGELTFKVDTKFADKTATLYWDNNGTLEKVGTCTVAADGAVKYAFTHASDYVLVFEDTAVVTPPVVNPVPEPVPSTGDMTSVATLLVIAGFAAVVVLSRKKFVQE